MSDVLARLALYERARRNANPNQPLLVEGLTRDELIVKYSKKVSFVARRIAHRLPSHAPIELDDLINTGALGLLDAIDKFDAEKNASFSTYVEFRIRGAILDLLRGLDPVSRSVREKANQLQHITRDLELRLRRPPESEEVAREMGISLQEYYDLLHEVRSVHLLSLDAPKDSDEEGSQTLGDTIEDESGKRPDGELEKKEALEVLADAIENGLPERLRQILVMYYFREMSLKEIGAALSVTESRVSQLHSEACLRLRARLAEQLRPGERFAKGAGRASRG